MDGEAEEGDDGFIGGDGWISDDSSFYGDAEERESLKCIVPPVDFTDYWETHNKSINATAFTARSIVHSLDKDVGRASELHNPLEGLECAWQLHEPIEDFLRRLPPLTSDVGPWIYVANPYPTPQSQRKGKGKEAGGSLVEEGEQMLQDFLGIRKGIEKKVSLSSRAKTESARKAAVTRQLGPHRKVLEEALRKLAIEKNMTSGKWMLFPAQANLHRIWRTVAEAVVTNRLGTQAKVAANGDNLICIYTYDFSDEADVRRVLNALVEIGLVPADGGNSGNGAIYYKCDAYTHLGLNSGNEYGLKPTFYASNTLLATPKWSGKAASKGEGRDRPLDLNEPSTKRPKLEVSASKSFGKKQDDLTGWVF